jgi:hypothetical protein
MDERRPPYSERRKRLRCIGRTTIGMMDDVVGLSGLKRHVESVEHDAGL